MLKTVNYSSYIFNNYFKPFLNLLNYLYIICDKTVTCDFQTFML